MRTKLRLTIEVEESRTDTNKLFQKIVRGENIKVNDIFNPESDIVITAFSNKEVLCVNEFGYVAEINCLMHNRGV